MHAKNARVTSRRLHQTVKRYTFFLWFNQVLDVDPWVVTVEKASKDTLNLWSTLPGHFFLIFAACNAVFQQCCKAKVVALPSGRRSRYTVLVCHLLSPHADCYAVLPFHSVYCGPIS